MSKRKIFSEKSSKTNERYLVSFNDTRLKNEMCMNWLENKFNTKVIVKCVKKDFLFNLKDFVLIKII
jgi:hypothetical protein